MFAILLHKGMDPFYQNITSFPTLIYTFILAICVLYWLTAVLGVINIDLLDLGSLDTGIDTDNDILAPNAMAGLMLKLGLNGIPVTIIISFLSLFGWLISYYCVHFLAVRVPAGILHILFGLFVLILAFWGSLLITALLLKGLRPFFQKVNQPTIKKILGKTAIVRTSKITGSFGEVFLNDGGAGLILKARSNDEQIFLKGDKVVLLEYSETDHTYWVISEQEFHS